MWMGFGKFQIILVLQVVLLAGGAISNAGAENNIERSFEVAAGGRLTVDTNRGSIEVRTADRDHVDVKIERNVRWIGRWSDEEVLEDLAVTFDHSDDGVVIRAKYGQENPRQSDWERNRLQIKFLITVPQRYNVDLKTSGAGISVTDLEGEVRSQTSGSNLRIGRITGSVWGRTSGGKIKVEGTEGDVDVQTSGGGITIGSVSGTIKAITSGGSIRIDGATGSVNARTSGSGITIGGVEGAVEAVTSGGSIRIDGVAASVNARTSGGGITIGSVAGAVETVASGGSIRIDRAGSVNAKTSGGGITVDEVMGSISAKTSGGSIKAYISRQPEGDCSLQTSGGGVTVYLVEDIAADVDAQASGGQVSTDIPVTTVVQGKVNKSKLQGAINGGGPLLKLRAAGGGVHLRENE